MQPGRTKCLPNAKTEGKMKGWKSKRIDEDAESRSKENGSATRMEGGRGLFLVLACRVGRQGMGLDARATLQKLITNINN